MKMISTYISLLLLCGFMLLFYYTKTYPDNKGGKVPAGQRNLDSGQKIFIKRADSNSFTKKMKDMEIAQQKQQLDEKGFSFFNDILGDIAPALKNLH